MTRMHTSPLGPATLAALGLAAVQLSGAQAAHAQGYTYTTLDPFGSTSTAAYGINAAGQVVGGYLDSSGNDYGYLATPIVTPEPSGFVGLGVGLLGLGALGMKARRRMT